VWLDAIVKIEQGKGDVNRREDIFRPISKGPQLYDFGLCVLTLGRGPESEFSGQDLYPPRRLKALRRPMATLALRAIVHPAPEQVVWYVDGKPFQVVDYPFTTRWPLTPGEHRFQVRFPGTDLVSNEVGVWVP